MRRTDHSVLRRICTGLAALFLSAGTAACGSVVEGQPVRPAPDLTGLDIGNYPSEPTHYSTAGDEKAARYREGQRLGDFVALPFEADPAYVTPMRGMGGPVVLDRRDMQSLVINDTFDDVATDLITGWVHTWSTDGDPATAAQMSIAVLMFPDAATAETVADGLEHDDFTFNTDNRPATLPGYPRSRAHWRPGTASLGSWTAHDRYVVYIKFDDLSGRTDLAGMVQRTEALLRVQSPLLDQFEPTPADQLTGIPLDPDGVLALALPKNLQTVAALGPPGAFRGRGALYALGGINSLDFLAEGQVSAIALAESVVMRSRTVVGAQALWQRFRPVTGDAANTESIDAPAGVTDGNVECFSRKAEQRPSTFCLLRTGRFFALVEGAQIQDLHQKTAAQYALLAG
ncbi:DUF7373 family lipoprotein [Nocardia grenadensis]|uniref:DUF7373 family lipoprotein n=1 Tax=Nocardia grenadensis TaxID=931537 RepID=UPI003D91D1EE